VIDLSTHYTEMIFLGYGSAYFLCFIYIMVGFILICENKHQVQSERVDRVLVRAPG
jgi:hypothetical protein